MFLSAKINIISQFRDFLIKFVEKTAKTNPSQHLFKKNCYLCNLYYKH